MKIVVTGADRALGSLLCHRLTRYEVVPVGASAESDLKGYRRVDLFAPDAVKSVLDGSDAVVHALPFDLGVDTAGAPGEGELLDLAARGTYVLATTAFQIGIERLVLLSRMDLMEDYPEEFLVNPDWKPLPRAEAGSLGPYMAELVCREIARTGKIEVACLRLGALDAEEGTSGPDAVDAVRDALEGVGETAGYNWDLRHVVSGGRFAR